jgi:phage shock protein PspC (stress-responsive transcriptional regulator)
METRRLTRSDTDRLVGGVCGGLAEYLQVDATLVRLGFVVLSALGGAGILIYLALWLLVPRGSQLDAPPRDVVRQNAEEGRRFAEDTARAAREAWQRRRGEEPPQAPPQGGPGGAPPGQGTSPPPPQGPLGAPPGQDIPPPPNAP